MTHAPQPPLPRRELAALFSCIIAWRRSILEAYHFDRAISAERLAVKLGALRAYVNAAGGADAFATALVEAEIGALTEPMFLEGLFRLETAVSVAWGLGLTSDIPDVHLRADVDATSGLFPLEGPPPWKPSDLAPKSPTEIADALGSWGPRLVAARIARDGSPDDPDLGIQFSRAFERTRGLAFLLTDAPAVGDIEPG